MMMAKPHSLKSKRPINITRTLKTSIVPILFTFAFLVLVSLVIVSGVLNHRTGDSKFHRVVISKAPDGTNSTFALAKDQLNNDTNNLLNYNVIVVKAVPVAIDPANYNFRIRFSFFPNGDFAQLRLGQQDGAYSLTKDMTLMFDSHSVTFTKNNLMPSREIAFGFISGDFNHYPFDVYSSTPIMISGRYNNGNASDLQDVPLRVEFTGSVLSYTVEAPGLDDLTATDEFETVYRGQLIEMDIVIKRAFATIFFSVMVMFILWLLSLLVLGVVIQIYFRDRTVEPPTAGIVVTLLFALPAVRNAQPGAPQIGCISDIVSFFWAMAISGIAGSLILINYTRKHKIRRPKPSSSSGSTFLKKDDGGGRLSLDEPLFMVGGDEDDTRTLNDDRRPLIK